MFNDDIEITGKHAHYMRTLAPRGTEEKRMRAFNRYIDVYMIGAVIGYINGRKEEIV